MAEMNHHQEHCGNCGHHSFKKTTIKDLPYKVAELPRELKKYYLGASESEIEQMLKYIGKKNLADLFESIPTELKFEGALGLGPALTYEELLDRVQEMALQNNVLTSFLGAGLPHFSIPGLVQEVCNIRGLTTAYTPYQPERSQGTLQTLWIYSNMMSKLTGFEAINASLYDRSTALFEGLCTMARVTNKNTVLVPMTVYLEDQEVLCTLATGTKLNIVSIPLNQQGRLDLGQLKNLMVTHKDDLAGVAFPQVTQFGTLEDVDQVTDVIKQSGILSLAIIDPLLLSKGGLKTPAQFGSDGNGVDFIVGEAQHLALAPNFGGPGLGMFGVRYNNANKMHIRSTPGRFVGKAKDNQGRPALAMVLSTREQHIRREKATSNICSNQSFVASIVGASILARGEEGMGRAIKTAHECANLAYNSLTKLDGIDNAFPNIPFMHEFVLRVKLNDLTPTTEDLLNLARRSHMHLAINVESRIPRSLGKPGYGYIMLCFTDRHTTEDIQSLTSFFKAIYPKTKTETITGNIIPSALLRTTPPGIPSLDQETLSKMYKRFGDMNVSPDDNVYPLGSCTMKYNPYINDFLAGLPQMTAIHPQAPAEDSQGCLEVLYEIQERFKKITGLPGVTTQPVAGAQGELVGLKLFQAYHRDRGENRDIILIPRSAHGTNPATATVAGFETKTENGVVYGIVILNADSQGQIDLKHLEENLSLFGKRIAGIMVTNPNTSGIFESNFHVAAKKIHDVGGLVYMDGANMNAIAGIVDLGKLGVDAVHNNLHKTWTIPHGGGGPGDAIVAVSAKLIPFLPGHQIFKEHGQFRAVKTEKSIGSIHRHYGNFAHKIRALSYILALGDEGVRKMSEVAVLCANYLYYRLKKSYPVLPENTDHVPRMHEFILTLTADDFALLEKGGTPKTNAIARVGKLFLDFGLHAPTVAFPEVYGLMFEPTESYSKAELDRFSDIVESMISLIRKHPKVLTTVPHFTPVYKIDEVDANKNIVLSESNFSLNLEQLLAPISKKDADVSPKALLKLPVNTIVEMILKSHQEKTV